MRDPLSNAIATPMERRHAPAQSSPRHGGVAYILDMLYIMHMSKHEGTGEPVLSTAEARTNLAATLGRVAYGGERVLIGKRGKAMAALVPLADLEVLRALEDSIDLGESRKSRREGGKNLSHAEVGKRLARRR
jgi:prevent-host-death family protein